MEIQALRRLKRAAAAQPSPAGLITPFLQCHAYIKLGVMSNYYLHFKAWLPDDTNQVVVQL